jgi:hypothetical protein
MNMNIQIPPPTSPLRDFVRKVLFHSATFFVFVSLISCGGDRSNTTGPRSATVVKKSCLSAYEAKLADLLKRDRVNALFGTKEVELKQSFSEGRSKSVSWSWGSERTRSIQVGANAVDFPHSNQVSISNFKVLGSEERGPLNGIDYVEANYRSISKEEMAAAQQRLQEQIQKRVEKGEITEEQAKLAGGLGGSIMGKERVVEPIEGVGDIARWVASDNTLAIGHGDVFFALYVDVSDDKTVNRDKAVALGKEILRECD